MNRVHSSRVYAVQTGRFWFDAEHFTGDNLGRFANMQGVDEILKMTMRQADKTKFTRMDWKSVRSFACDLANAEYQVKSGKLFVVAKDNVPASREPTEVFIYYGDVQSYWLPLVSSSPENFPESIVGPVRWLLTSPGCNWSESERCQWSGLCVGGLQSFATWTAIRFCFNCNGTERTCSETILLYCNVSFPKMLKLCIVVELYRL